jgi:hypothetical protein
MWVAAAARQAAVNHRVWMAGSMRGGGHLSNHGRWQAPRTAAMPASLSTVPRGMTRSHASQALVGWRTVALAGIRGMSG